MQEKQPAIYIAANKENGTLYTGVTSNLIQRIYQHKNHVVEGFSCKYDCTILVYYELYEDMENAIRREKRLKKYKRSQKVKLIEENNPSWCDLYDQLF